jgi:hypothetical protein
MFQTKVVKKINTHVSHAKTFFYKNHAIYEIILKNMVEPDRPQ